MIITDKDFSDNLRKLDKRALILHGDGDNGTSLTSRSIQADLFPGMPSSASADLIKDLMPKGLCEVRIYEKAAHGLYLTHAERVMEDLLNFIVSVSAERS